MPIAVKDETGEMTEDEEKEMEKIQFRIDYQEIFLSKFGSFKAEIDGKLDYARTEFKDLSERSEKLLKQFGCDPNRYKPKDLFALLFDFAKDFSEAYKRMQHKIKTE